MENTRLNVLNVHVNTYCDSVTAKIHYINSDHKRSEKKHYLFTRCIIVVLLHIHWD